MDERNITFECKKCMHQLILLVPKKMTINQLLKKLEGLQGMECPNCGEESHHNWYFDSVNKTLPTDVHWIDAESKENEE